MVNGSDAMNLYIDGSSPHEKYYPSSYCIFNENKFYKSKVLEKNFPAQDTEYFALIETLYLIIKEELVAGKIVIFSDCGFMVREVKGKRKPTLVSLCKITKTLFKEANKKCEVKLRVIKREKNIAGIYLEKRLAKLKGARDEISKPQPNPQLKKQWRKKVYGK